MIDFIKMYPLKKANLEEEVLMYKYKFQSINSKYDNLTSKPEYPINAKMKGVSFLIDEYRCYTNCNTKVILNANSKSKIPQNRNLKFSELKRLINILTDLNLNIETNKISKLFLFFTISISNDIERLINTNIYLHKSRNYNRNKCSNKKSRFLKEFVYENYTLGFYSIIDIKSKEPLLEITLKLNKSVEFNSKELSIKTINDFRSKRNLEELFKLFLKRLNEVVVVDDFENINGKDGELLEKYLNNRFWKDIDLKYSRQTKSRHFKHFLSLIEKHKLNTSKIELEHKIKETFNEFLNN